MRWDNKRRLLYSGYAMPYTYFVITPYSNAKVVMHVR
jgi:hypothetical protein